MPHDHPGARTPQSGPVHVLLVVRIDFPTPTRVLVEVGRLIVSRLGELVSAAATALAAARPARDTAEHDQRPPLVVTSERLDMPSPRGRR
ncbi:hypothetical protein BJ970_006139 [Saccharopolyspora phatthalungensis]|uniref:Uncharacterized protein n=1 Tax=Saccharopolyspora phatthalungensis TaxID=664693 RepID=A0A840QF60_9PSEU|nr:hypothetical protein [Saccharopolyspora phatthalungensis]